MASTFAALVFIFLTSAYYLDFLIGRLVPLQDSFAILSKLHIFYRGLFSGEVPLWDPFQNAGQPIWPMLELGPVYDPVALLVWGVAWIFHAKSTVALVWTIYLWLVVFSIGVALCSRFILKNWQANLLAFIVIFGGGVATSSSLQAHGFLLPFRYLPFVIYFLFSYSETPSRNGAILLALVCGIASLGYQAPYLLPLLVIFSFGFKSCFQRWDTVLIVGIIILIVLPSCIAARELFQEYPAGRTDLPWFLNIKQLFLQFVDVRRSFSATHGNGYLGVIPLALALLALLSWRRLLHLEKCWVWVVVTLSVSFPLLEWVVGSYGTFLGMRNWGFMLTPLLFGLSQLVVTGFRLFLHQRPVWIGTIVLLVTTFDMAHFLHAAHANYADLYPVAQRVTNLAPRFEKGAFDILQTRALSTESMRYFPFHFHSPALFQRRTAVSEVTVPVNVLGVGPQATHWSELRRHREVVASAVSANERDRWLGVGERRVSLSQNMAPANLKGIGWNRLKLAIASPPDGGWVHLNDAYDRHWEATVDSVPAKVELAPPLLMKLFVPGGNHAVEFEYRPRVYLAASRLRNWTLFLSLFYVLGWNTLIATAKRIRPKATWSYREGLSLRYQRLKSVKMKNVIPS